MNHTRNHYAIAGVLLLLGVAGYAGVQQRIGAIPLPRVQHFAWPGLPADQQAALVTALDAVTPHAEVTVWCANANCSDLAEDMQFVAYQAGWDTHSDAPVLGAGQGLNVAPDTPQGRAIAKAIETATGIKVGLFPGRPGQTTYDIVIGAR